MPTPGRGPQTAPGSPTPAPLRVRTATTSRVPVPDRASGRRLKLYSRAVAAAVVVAWTLTVLLSSGADTAAGRLGGDYPAFYAAGEIVADGDWENLYSPQRQAQAQAALFPGSDNSVLYFAYPPYVASMYRPLAGVDYRVSYALHTLVMVGSVIGALWLLRPAIGGVLKTHFELVAIAALLFFPLFRAVSGGQNTALTLLLLAGVWRGLHERRIVVAGICAGLLLYKPQFAIPLLLLFLLRGHWRATVTGAATGAGLWLLGVATMGWGWLGSWWTEVAAFAEKDADVNGHNAISWLGFAEGVFGASSTTAYLVAGPLVLATVAALAWLWFRGAQGLDQRMALTVAGLVFISPHAMYYDGGLFLLAGLVAVNALGTRATLPVALVWVLAWSQAGASSVGFAPLFALLLLGAAALGAAATRPSAPLHRPTAVAS